MKLTFITNACCIYESQGFKILCDPWLTDGAFYGSWTHSPPLKTRPADVADFDALYISHLHPDHFDPETLKHFDKTKPVIILDRELNYLERMVRAEGFTNVLKTKDGESLKIGPFTVHMFGPFCGHPFFETQIGNPIDSAIVVEDERTRVFNANDNTPDLKAARMIKEKFGEIHVAQLNYNAAGPYPSCFSNLNHSAKLEAHEALLERNLSHLTDLLKILQVHYLMPFAGAYKLKGSLEHKNAYLGTTTAERAASFVQRRLFGHKVLVLEEGRTFDIGTGVTYLEKDKAYPFENESIPPQHTMDFLVTVAIKNLRHHQERLGCYPDVTVQINERYIVRLSRDEKEPVDPNLYQLKATMDPGLLYWILIGKAHWNNAEIGCHIEFYREPNVYIPDAHLLMSFFHVPKNK